MRAELEEKLKEAYKQAVSEKNLERLRQKILGGIWYDS